MITASTLLLFYGALFLAVGISILRSDFNAAFESLIEHKGLLWLTGLLTFLIGLVSVLLYRDWTGMTTGSLVTLFGWLTLVKGATILLAPGFAVSYYQSVSNSSLIKGAGIIAIVLGLLCFYLVSV